MARREARGISQLSAEGVHGHATQGALLVMNVDADSFGRLGADFALERRVFEDRNKSEHDAANVRSPDPCGAQYLTWVSMSFARAACAACAGYCGPVIREVGSQPALRRCFG